MQRSVIRDKIVHGQLPPHARARRNLLFTVTLRDRRSGLLVAYADTLRATFREVRRTRPFTVDAIVVIPDHVHAVWTLPPGDADYSGRWRAIKARFTRSLVRDGVPCGRDRRGEYDLWQRRFWEHLILDDDDFARHVDYIHHNPVKHGLAATPFDWRLSSIHAFARRGILSPDWRGMDARGIRGPVTVPDYAPLHPGY